MIVFTMTFRASSDLLRKFLVMMKLEQIAQFSAIFSQNGKIYLLNLDCSTNWECFRLIENFFIQLGKYFVPETGTSFVWRKSPDIKHAQRNHY